MHDFYKKLSEALYCELTLRDAEREYAYNSEHAVLKDRENAAAQSFCELKNLACEYAQNNLITDALAEEIDNSNDVAEAYEYIFK